MPHLISGIQVKVEKQRLKLKCTVFAVIELIYFDFFVSFSWARIALDLGDMTYHIQ